MQSAEARDRTTNPLLYLLSHSLPDTDTPAAETATAQAAATANDGYKGTDTGDSYEAEWAACVGFSQNLKSAFSYESLQISQIEQRKGRTVAAWLADQLQKCDH